MKGTCVRFVEVVFTKKYFIRLYFVQGTDFHCDHCQSHWSQDKAVSSISGADFFMILFISLYSLINEYNLYLIIYNFKNSTLICPSVMF